MEVRTYRCIVKSAMPQTKPDTLVAPIQRGGIFTCLRLVDRLYLGYLLAMAVLAIARTMSWPSLVLTHALIAALIITLARNAQRSAVARFLHDWYPLVMFIFSFEQVARFSLFLVPHWQDHWVIALEARLFGVSPNFWLVRFSSPVLSELMDLGYFSYYPTFPIAAGLLYARSDRRAFHELMLTSVLMYLLCFIAYLAVPTEGPRHAFGPRITPPSGAFFSWLVSFIQQGAGVHGNALPSSHVALAFLCVVFSWRHLRTLAPWFTAFFPLICAGAVYDGYHYLSDIAGGVIVAAIALLIFHLLPFDIVNSNKTPHR